MRTLILINVLFIAVSMVFSYSLTDIAEGWASMNGGTTGGTGGEKITASTSEQFIEAATSTGKKIILVKKGEYTVGILKVKSNKSILGLEPGVVVDGEIAIRDSVHNIIIRNIAVINSKKCNDYGVCKKGTDAMNIMYGAHNVWLDHLDISDGLDGNLDITKGSDFITVTWCKFWYSYPKPHAFSNLIAGSTTEPMSRGKLRITYAYCWWGKNCQERQPFGRMGKVHLLNNLWTSQRTKHATACGNEMQMLVENNVYNCSGTAFLPDRGDYKLIGNVGTNKKLPGKDKGVVFTPPYKMSLRMDASEVETRIRAECGNTLTLETTPLRDNGKMQKSAIKPYTIPSETGLILFNPTSLKLAFTVFKINGQTVLPTTYLEAGKRLQLPSMASLVYIRIKGLNVQVNGLYLPLINNSL